MRWRSLLTRLLLVAIPLGTGLWFYDYARRHPEDLPWTALDLNAPIGAFTGRKLTALIGDPPACRRKLAAAGIAFTALPDRRDGPHCGYDDGIRLDGGGAVTLAPHGTALSCPVAAAFSVWQRQVVAPAAQRHFGSDLARIDHLGSYNCRRINGRPTGRWSEHATADALDIAAFVLNDGRRITLQGDWDGAGPEARFLREVREGACTLFATVLSPDYNAAHADHFHLDQADRGQYGWRVCR